MSDIPMIGLAALAFAATNIDGAFLLIAFMADPTSRVRDVVLGQFLGSTSMTLICVLVAKASMATPYSRYLGMLGLLQVVIGLKRLHNTRRPALSDGVVYNPAAGRAGDGVLTVAVTAIGSFGDNFTVYVPLFATAGVGGLGTSVTVFTIMTGLWCLVAYWVANLRVLRQQLQRASRLYLPWLLIVLGIVLTGRAVGGVIWIDALFHPRN